MENESARDMAIWMAQMAQDYSQPVLIVVDYFDKAIQLCDSAEKAKLLVINNLETKTLQEN